MSRNRTGKLSRIEEYCTSELSYFYSATVQILISSNKVGNQLTTFRPGIHPGESSGAYFG